MKEKPILFSGPMVRAILDGRKTQTRRIVKFNNNPWREPLPHVEYARDGMPIWWGSPPTDEIRQSDYYDNGYPCPYGKTGDRLWVREQLRWIDGAIRYAADEAPVANVPTDLEIIRDYIPSIHMPRWASRLTLEIESVRVERVQEISEADAQAEGMYPAFDLALSGQEDFESCRASFAHLWMRVNGKESWQRNDWVWAISFKRVEAAHA